MRRFRAFFVEIVSVSFRSNHQTETHDAGLVSSRVQGSGPTGSASGGPRGSRIRSRVADPLTDPQVISVICVTLSLTRPDPLPLARANYNLQTHLERHVRVCTPLILTDRDGAGALLARGRGTLIEGGVCGLSTLPALVAWVHTYP